MTRLEQYQNTAKQYQNLLDSAYADLSTQFKRINDILDSLSICTLSVRQKNEKDLDNPELKITFSTGTGRQGRQIYFDPVSPKQGISGTNLNSLTRNPELYEFVCQIWLLYHEDILKSINREISNEMQKKEKYLNACKK